MNLKKFHKALSLLHFRIFEGSQKFTAFFAGVGILIYNVEYKRLCHYPE